MPHTRSLKCLVLQNRKIKTWGVIRRFEWVEILGFTVTWSVWCYNTINRWLEAVDKEYTLYTSSYSSLFICFCQSVTLFLLLCFIVGEKISKKISKNWTKIKINRFSSPLLGKIGKCQLFYDSKIWNGKKYSFANAFLSLSSAFRTSGDCKNQNQWAFFSSI